MRRTVTMGAYNMRRLVIVSSGRGGSVMKLFESVGQILRQKGALVYDIAPDLTVYEALERMVARNIGALVVMSGADLVGLVSERDYARKVILKGRSSREMKVH